MTSWKTSLIGLALILLGIAGMAFLSLDKVTGGALITAGLGFLLTKDSQVTGGTVPQANAPGVVERSDLLGVVAAVDAIKSPSQEEVKIKEMAKEILAEPPVAPDKAVKVLAISALEKK